MQPPAGQIDVSAEDIPDRSVGLCCIRGVGTGLNRRQRILELLAKYRHLVPLFLPSQSG